MDTEVSEIATGIYRLSTLVPDVAPPVASPSTSTWSPANSRCCSTPGSAPCSPPHLRRGGDRAPAGATALDQLRPRGGRRMRGGDEPLAGGGTAGSGAVQRSRDQRFAQRPGRPPTGGRRSRSADRHRRARVPDHPPPPHVPHGWEAQLLYDRTTRTLFCGDLFTRIGHTPATGGRCRPHRAGPGCRGHLPLHRPRRRWPGRRCASWPNWRSTRWP